jgi:two-component system CheB/CheR fusion protein
MRVSLAARRQHHPPPVIGIGASAGGIEALGTFFRALPSGSGLAFVVVTHLPPGRESSIVQVLAQFTPMPVVAAADGLVPQPNQVAVLSRSGTLTLEDGRLRLRESEAANRERHPIDVFFASLAEDRGEHCAGIILSGGGSDGTLGIKAIKQGGGLTLAQGGDHTEPRHGGMPSSAIATGLIDLVLPVQDMPAKLVEYIDGFDLAEDESAEHVVTAREAICRILRSQVGHDFSGYKDKTFLRRVRRRMHVLQLGDMEAYVGRLRQDPDEGRRLFRDLLISVTSFFRDQRAFEELASQVIPHLFEGRGADEPVRVWVPACATGEEVYSLAILLLEAMDAFPMAPKVQIFATDIDEPALAVARAARYPAPLLDDVSPARLERFFTRSGASYVLTKEVRDLCVFSAHSIIRDPPFSRIDLISCRNLLIYLDGDLQRRVIPIFHYALRPGAYLFLGTSENITQQTDLFAPLTKKHRVFQRRDNINAPLPLPLSAPGRGAAAASPLLGRATLGPARSGELAGLPLRNAIERRVLERFAPAYVVVDRNGDVVYYSAGTGRYLEAAAGTPTRELFAMARKGLRSELRTALREAVEGRRQARREGLAVDLDHAGPRVTLIVDPLPERDGDPLFVVVFEETRLLPAAEALAAATTASSIDRGAVDQLESELHETRDRLQSAIEEYETALEELKSANEELVSVNEELQSANEELETAKEEQQSVNEELHTVNLELQGKVDELDRANADLKNLFDSTEIATVFLDRHLVIRTFTPAVTAIFNLIPTDRGRPLTDIASQLEGVDLRADIRRVLDTREPLERPVRARAEGGSHYLMRLLPYRARDNSVEGVLVTFIDVTNVVEAKRHEDMLVGELNERVRDALAFMVGLVMDGASRTPAARGFSDRLVERLHALAEAYKLIARDNWRPVPLRELVERELEPYRQAGDEARVTIAGAATALAPRGALAFMTALRELTMNAARHGALSDPAGRLEIAWSIEGSDGPADRRRLVLRWAERGGPAISAARREGLPNELLERIFGGELGGTATIDLAQEGIRAELAAPLGRAVAGIE